MDQREFMKRQEIRKRRKKQMMRRRMTFFSLIILLVVIVSVVLAVRHNTAQNKLPDPTAPAATTAPPQASDTPQGSSEPQGSDAPADPSASPSADASAEPTIDPNLANQVVFPLEPEKPADILQGLNMEDGKKVAYLTFDDGPTMTVTPKILDTLRRYNVKATFFQVGSLIEENPDMARRVYDEGHLLGNHSYAHNYSKLYATEESFMSEIDKTYQLIADIVGNENYPKVFRFPGGGYNAGSWGANKQKYKEVLAQRGIRYCDWNALNGDAEGGTRSAAQLLERVKNTAKKEDVVILMHDAAAKKTTAEALPSIIEYLISQGYEFKRLDEA